MSRRPMSDVTRGGVTRVLVIAMGAFIDVWEI